ncbi:uncharacterized protein LOC143037425 [Oratosquilla oratoria]|uniref:uncharacterized protein LOC143037425 n=1 Tax=Oratosquilla oratoria TaxID=337810 RepID=UPI003F776D2D
MSLLSPGLVLPLTPPADPHLFLDDPFFEQTRHHFDLTVKQMSNRWSLNSPDHLSPFRSLHQNNVAKEESSEPGTKQHKIIEIQVEAEDDDDTAEKNRTKNTFSNRPQSSTAETSEASESSSSQVIRNQDTKKLVAGEPTEKDTKSSSLGGGLSLHRKLLPTLHQDPIFDDSFFRDVQSDFEETFDSILKDHNAKAASKKLEEQLSIPEDEGVNEVKANTEEESSSDYQKNAVSEQVARGCDSNVKGSKGLVEEGQGMSCAGSSFARTSRPRPSLSSLMRQSAIEKSLSLNENPTNKKKKDDKACQDATRVYSVDDEDKTDDVDEDDESSHEIIDEDSEMMINEEEQEFLLSDEEDELTNSHLESGLDTIIEEPSTPMQELKEDKDIFKKELCNEQQNEHNEKEQDSNSNTLALNNSELLKQDSNKEPSVASPAILNLKLDQPTPPKIETPTVPSPQDPKYTLLRETDSSGVVPAKIEAASSPLFNSLKPDKVDIIDIIKRSSKAQENIVKDEKPKEMNEKTSSEEPEEKLPTNHHNQQTSPQSKRSSRVRFEDLPEEPSEQQKQNSKTQEDDNQNTPCIKEHNKEKKDQERKNKKLHLFIPEIKISGVQCDDSVPLELDHTSDDQKSPEDLKSIEQSLEQEENKQKTTQAPTSESKSSVSSKRVRTESMNSTLSESSDISKPESYSIVNSSKKESQGDSIIKNDSTKKPKNDASCTATKTMLIPSNTKEGELPIQQRGSFFRDSTFKDDHKHFRSAVSKVLERFGIRSSADDEMNAYKTLRQWISVGESQAAKFIDGKTTYKVVLDMSEFTAVKAKIDGQILVIEGLPLGKEANSNQISRRCFIFPTSVEMESVTSALSSDGVLTVTGPKRQRHSLCQEDAIR